MTTQLLTERRASYVPVSQTSGIDMEQSYINCILTPANGGPPREIQLPASYFLEAVDTPMGHFDVQHPDAVPHPGWSQTEANEMAQRLAADRTAAHILSQLDDGELARRRNIVAREAAMRAQAAAEMRRPDHITSTLRRQ